MNCWTEFGNVNFTVESPTFHASFDCDLAERVEKVLALHVPYGVYDECEHDHTDAEVLAGMAIDVDDVGRTCEAGKLYELCAECHLVNDEVTEDCGDINWIWPCKTVRALDGE